MEINQNIKLSTEQKSFIEQAKQGHNILVNACIGSGKTTTIQHLCNELPACNRILYLTYNKLLKYDAKEKIKKRNVTVTNYHGFAYGALCRMGIHPGNSDSIQLFNKVQPQLYHYDIMIIDEYQDIDQEISEMLEFIKSTNPQMQIIAVGDMDQKIYDKTTLKVREWIDSFLGSYIQIEFTNCFRLSAPICQPLGRIWDKAINGVNRNCRPKVMDKCEIVEFLSKQDPGDILCLGSRTGIMTKVLNALETKYPQKFNKYTVYASIQDNDSMSRIEPSKDTAIFTTYDGSKGLERKICVVFDFTEDYWMVRLRKPMQSMRILRNIFCVAASRGKEQIIFVDDGKALLSEDSMKAVGETCSKDHKKTSFEDMAISEMFGHKYKEDIEACFSALKIRTIKTADQTPIEVQTSDAMIDLSPCIGIYQEAMYFDKYDIDKEIDLFFKVHKELSKWDLDGMTLDKKILYLVSLMTQQERYRKQVKSLNISTEIKDQISKRLATNLKPYENIQEMCEIAFAAEKDGSIAFSAHGRADVVKDDTVYELKFVTDLTHEHFLQCACYIIALGLKKGILWNVRTNEIWKVQVPDKKRFLDLVAKTITKHTYKEYYAPMEFLPNAEEKRTEDDNYLGENNPLVIQQGNKQTSNEKIDFGENIAILDAETNCHLQTMSVGCIIVDKSLTNVIEEYYYILTPECEDKAIFSNALNLAPKEVTDVCLRNEMIWSLEEVFSEFGVKSIFAYNASFDKIALRELYKYQWFDIMKVAAYKDLNPKLPPNRLYCSTGRLKSKFGVESMMRLLSGNKAYTETHNALLDCRDEFEIMKLVGQPIEVYKAALIE